MEIGLAAAQVLVPAWGVAQRADRPDRRFQTGNKGKEPGTFEAEFDLDNTIRIDCEFRLQGRYRMLSYCSYGKISVPATIWNICHSEGCGLCPKLLRLFSSKPDDSKRLESLDAESILALNTVEGVEDTIVSIATKKQAHFLLTADSQNFV